jgi:hypothetical protein
MRRRDRFPSHGKSILTFAAHPAFAPYLKWLSARAPASAPAVGEVQAWATAASLALPDGRPLTIAPAAGPLDAIGYEQSIARDARIPLRPGAWHDVFNVLAWLAFPLTKAALNARHVAEGLAMTPNRRSRVRDAATLLDESGLLVACSDPSLRELLRAHAWRDLFLERAGAVREHLVAVAIGHGLLERLRAPHRALTAKVLWMSVPSGVARPSLGHLDAMAAERVASRDFVAESLLPLPVAAIPGWDTEQLGAALFDDVSVFRPKVLGSPP